MTNQPFMQPTNQRTIEPKTTTIIQTISLHLGNDFYQNFLFLLSNVLSLFMLLFVGVCFMNACYVSFLTMYTNMFSILPQNSTSPPLVFHKPHCLQTYSGFDMLLLRHGILNFLTFNAAANDGHSTNIVIIVFIIKLIEKVNSKLNEM